MVKATREHFAYTIAPRSAKVLAVGRDYLTKFKVVSKATHASPLESSIYKANDDNPHKIRCKFSYEVIHGRSSVSDFLGCVQTI